MTREIVVRLTEEETEKVLYALQEAHNWLVMVWREGGACANTSCGHGPCGALRISSAMSDALGRRLDEARDE